MEKGYSIELLEQQGTYQKLRITVEGGVSSLILENRQQDGLSFYREDDEPKDPSLFKRVQLKTEDK